MQLSCAVTDLVHLILMPAPSHPPYARLSLVLSIGIIVLPFVLALALAILSTVWYQPGIRLDSRPYPTAPYVGGWLVLTACALWVLQRRSRLWLFAILPNLLFVWLSLVSLRYFLDALNQRDDSPPVVRAAFVLGSGSSVSRSKYGSTTSYYTILSNWRGGDSLTYPAASPAAEGDIVCLEERRGRFGRAWAGHLRPCQQVPPPFLPSKLKATSTFQSRTVTSLIGARLSRQPFALAAYFDASAQVRWLLGAPLRLGVRARQQEGIYERDADKPRCPLGLAGLSSDNATVWSLAASNNPDLSRVLRQIEPFEATRAGNLWVSVIDRHTCQTLATVATKRQILDVDVDAANRRLALLVTDLPAPDAAKPAAPTTGQPAAAARPRTYVELWGWNGTLLDARTVALSYPLQTKLTLIPPGIALMDRGRNRLYALIQDDRLVPQSAQAPDYERSFTADRHRYWSTVVDDEIRGRVGEYAVPEVVTPASVYTHGRPLRTFPLPDGGFSASEWRVVTASADGAAVLAVHARLPYGFLLDTASGHWHMINDDLRAAQVSFSPRGNALAYCVEDNGYAPSLEGTCRLLARPDGQALFAS